MSNRPTLRRNRLRALVLEDRTVPAAIHILTETVSGAIDVSMPDGTQAQHGDLMTYWLHPVGDAYQGAQKIEFPAPLSSLDISTIAAFPGLMVGTSTAQVDLSFRLDPGAGELAGQSVPATYNAAVRPPTGPASETAATLTGPGVNFAATTRADAGTFPLVLGETYTLHVVTSLTWTVADQRSGYFNQASSEFGFSVPTPSPRVQADFDSIGPTDDQVFGTYLTGVKLNNTFRVTTPDTDTITKKFRFSIDGGPDAARTVARATAETLIPFDMGRLAANPDLSDRDYRLTVDGLDASGAVVSEFVGTIKVEGKLGLDLRVQAQFDTRAAKPLEQVRLIAGVARQPLMNFRPKISGTVSDFYSQRLAIGYSRADTDRLIGRFPLIVAGDGTATLPGGLIKGALFADVVGDPQKFDYDFVVTPGRSSQEGNTPYRFSPPSHLLVIPRPGWIKTTPTEDATGAFVADDKTAAAFGAGAAGYELTIDLHKKYGLALPKTTGAAFAALSELDGLKGLANLPSQVSMEAGFTVVAPLFLTDPDPKVHADRMTVLATLLSQEFKEFTLPDLDVTATVDNRTLAAPTSVTVRPASPIDLIPALTRALGGQAPEIHHRFGPWKLSVPVFTAGLLSVNGDLDLAATVDGALVILDLSGAMTFGFTNGRLDPAKTTGTFALDVFAHLAATLTGGGGISVSAFGYTVNLVRLEASMTVNVDFFARVAAQFGPDGLALDSANTHATMDVSWQAFNYNLAALEKNNPGEDLQVSPAFDSTALSVWDF